MADPVEHEVRPSPRFTISSYKDGAYQPNGVFTEERLLSDAAIAEWERDNVVIAGGKAWGIGQALFFNDRDPLIFGRNTPMVDVKFDGDPSSEGYMQFEGGVSRRHFALTPTPDGRIFIKDLDSTNGVKVFTEEGSLKFQLKGERSEGILEVGDFTLLGGGEADSSPASRLIGFRVCLDNKGRTFLVKFNAKDIDDLLAMVGVVRSQVDTTRVYSRPELPVLNPEAEQEVAKGYQELLKTVERIVEVRKTGRDASMLIRLQALLAMDAVRVGTDIAKRFFNGDLDGAMTALGVYALRQGDKYHSTGDKKEAAHATQLSLFLNKLSSGEFIESIKEE